MPEKTSGGRQDNLFGDTETIFQSLLVYETEINCCTLQSLGS